MSKPTRGTARKAAFESAAVIAPASQTNELLLETEVMARCRIKSRAQLWKLEQAGQFPTRRRYGMRRVAWLASEIDEWISLGIDEWLKRVEPKAA